MQCSRKPTITSFFSGMGGLDLGFKELFDIQWANEFNPHAAHCYEENIGRHIRVGDITKVPLRSIPKSNGFIGGPSCIDFSSAGVNRGIEGDHGKLAIVYQEIIRRMMPDFFLFENVEGLLTRHSQSFYHLIDNYKDMGFNVTWALLNAAHFGVAQERNRVFIAGIRKDLGFHFSFPTPSYVKRTVRQAIGDLPTAETIGARERVLGITPNHTATWESPTPERLFDVIQHPRNQHRGMRRLEWDKPSPTITAHIAKDGREFLHPSENRRITVREALRLSGFLDSFTLPADVPLSAQYRCVGNCVAFPVASALAKAMYQQIQFGSIQETG
ncbi:DNA (cytosine-5)-methyltransferase 1 [Paenibacillus sp. PastF-3]|uniref:DNA cytosine methyltransferase n=1 Tax=Paenibacillus sp. PastF-3 TaxID=2940626 RepID=UPI002475EE20|nr:DNA (cytosine-5-)-methyltransferase [Paenibacillus sp. PastF-3]MDH6374316.1 DNA (cytosine-5)-methyltransferase 1 [Paenibacillus sp. PastF-3]